MTGPGRPKGMKNKRTIIREQRIAQAAQSVENGTIDISDFKKDGVQVMEYAMAFFYVLAEKELRAGGNPRDDLKTASEIAKDVAQYHRPKLTSIRHGGDPDLPPVKLENLSNEQLDFLIDRLLQGLTTKGSGGTISGTGTPT